MNVLSSSRRHAASSRARASWRMLRWLPLAAAPVLAAVLAVPPALAGTVARAAAAVVPEAAGTARTPSATPVAPQAVATSLAVRGTVTLLTGDRVTYQPPSGPGKLPTVRVTAAPRPPGEPPVVFSYRSTPRGYYVIPADALGLVSSGALDPELFNVSALLRQGLGDNAAATLPVIAQYTAAPGSPAAGQAPPLPDVTVRTALPVVHGSGLMVGKKDARAFWQALAYQPRHMGEPARRRSTPASGIATLWLDERMRASDLTADQQIGAPAAWAAGLDGTGVTVAVVDTGIDATHPDLVGKVAAAKNFSDDPGTADHFGHGTWVASILAGTGAASGGRYKGVAPGATLISAKALDSQGFGLESWVMAAMAWAALDEHARIVNMSLGGCCGQDNDPISQELDALSAKTGALFVVAAGNNGSFAAAVDSPGAATAALTVGAVDGHDRLADFSSRGPRFPDGAAKPDLTAPGVDIVGARAAGTDLGGAGTPIGSQYIQASGTSAATPMVTGAAAILHQQHPTWSGSALKDALMATAHDDGYPYYQQGTGRVDVATAITNAVYPSAQMDFGSTRHGGTPVTDPIIYTNAGTKPVTLTLSVSPSGWDGQPAPGAFTLAADTVTVPAGGTASVPVTFNPDLGRYGAYGGTVTATIATTASTGGSGGTSLRAVLGGYASASSKVTVNAINARGEPIDSGSLALGSAFFFTDVSLLKVDLANPASSDDPFLGDSVFRTLQFTDGVATTTLAPGTYSAQGVTFDWHLGFHRLTFLAATNIAVPENGSVTVTLDATRAVPTGVTVGGAPGDQLDQRGHGVSLVAATQPAPPTLIGVPVVFGAGDGTDVGEWDVPIYVTPAAPASAGTLSLEDTWMLADSMVRIRTRGGLALHPQFDHYGVTQLLPGRRSLPVVFVGDGQLPGDFTAARGAAALVRLDVPAGTPDPVGWAYQAAQTAVTNANAAGAAAVFLYLDMPAALPLPFLPSGQIATFALSAAEGQALAQRLRERDKATVGIATRADPAFVDTLDYLDYNGVPTTLTRSADQRQLTVTPVRYHAERPGLALVQWWYGVSPSLGLDVVNPQATFQAPAEWTDNTGWFEFGGPAEKPSWHRVAYLSTPDTLSGVEMETDQPPTGRAEDWFGAPFTLGAAPPGFVPVSATGECGYCRLGPWGGDPTGASDLFVPSTTFADATPGHYEDIGWPAPFNFPLTYFSDVTWTLTRDGRPVPPVTPPGCTPFGPCFLWAWAVGAAPAAYRLEGMTDLAPTGMTSTAVLRTTPRTDTVWTFTSQRVDGPSCGYFFEAFAACVQPPLIQLDYQPALDLFNQAPAGRPYTFTLDAAAPPSPGATPVTRLSVAYSTDSGRIWRQAATSPLGGGRYQVTVLHPPLDRTNGFVWLRTQAVDHAGDSVVQTVQNAYALTGHPGTPPPAP